LHRPRPSFGSIAVRTPVANPGQRIGIMGGSFNPPHDGHRVVALTALKRCQLDQVWWVVTPGNPLKANGGLPPLDERLAACRRLANHPRMRVTAFEQELGSPFTAVTLAFLKQRHPSVAFVWVMGADNLAGFHRWQNWPGIAAAMPLVVVDRPGWRLRALATPVAHALTKRRQPEAKAATLPRRATPAWSFLTTRLSALSSTALRGGSQPS
jgi:nicotinate-nucleotide adenylyltransferase